VKAIAVVVVLVVWKGGGLAAHSRAPLADYANGLFTVDLATGIINALTPPAGRTLLGIDGITAVGAGIVAVQNGVEPQRVVRINLTPDFDAVSGIEVLAAALPNLGDLSLITLVNGQPTLIAGSGWEGFDPAKAKQPAAHTVRIFQATLP
jgi:hypothetical protein